MNIIGKFFKHLFRVCKHKFWVFYYSCHFGIPWRGLVHDLSKFSPVEFWSGVKYYQDGISPIKLEKADTGYSTAWLHHKGRNKHHWEYWTDFHNGIKISVKIPWKYLLEMTADFLAAGRIYTGKTGKNLYISEYSWLRTEKNTMIIHPSSLLFLNAILWRLSESGIKNIRPYLMGLKDSYEKIGSR